MFDLAIFTHIALGVVQGLTEFLPVSSSGHLILAHELVGSAGGASDLAFDALLHFATALAIILYFRHDLWRLTRTLWSLPFFPSNRITGDEKVEDGTSHDRELLYALIVGTIPAVVLGLLLENILATLFRNPLLVAAALVVGSGIMFVGERYQRGLYTYTAHVSAWGRGLIIGLFQSLALIPGMSRSGMTISGGLLLGMNRTSAARFGFLLGIPLFLGAGAKKALEIGLGEITLSMFGGTAAAFVVALLVIHFLLKFLRNHTLYVFVAYRLALAALIVALVVL